MSYKLNAGGVLKDGSAHIPNDPENKDWKEFLVWVADGNTPDPMDIPAVVEPPLSVEELYAMLKTKGVLVDNDRPRGPPTP